MKEGVDGGGEGEDTGAAGVQHPPPSRTRGGGGGGGGGGASLLHRRGVATATSNPAVNTTLGGHSVLTFGSTAFGAAVNGVATANSITNDSSADNSGTATFFRALESDGSTVVFQGTVGTSGAELNLNTTSIVQQGTVSVTSLTYTQATS